MGGKRDLNPVVDIEPFGMMIVTFRQQRNAAHEAPRLAEIAKLERARHRRAIARGLPLRMLGEQRCAFIGSEFGNGHFALLVRPRSFA